MKNNDKNQDKKEQKKQAADISAEASEQEDLGIDRDEMTEEEYIGELEIRIGKCMAETIVCRNLAQRMQADFDNYRKRNASLAEESKKLGEAMVIEKMLTVLDNCALARQYLTDEASLTGFNMMETQILSALNMFGLKEIETDGKQFDAKTMSAVETVKSDGNENMVAETVSKGYFLNDKLLRPASVKVSK